MKKRILFPIFLALLAGFTSCDKNPMGKLVDPTASNTTGVWSGTWVIYDDEVKTNGGILLFNEGTSLDFNYTDKPRSGTKCIRYAWDGSAVLTHKSPPAHPVDYYQSDFVGFSFIAASNTDDYLTVTRNLSLGGFTKITFWAKGYLSDHVFLRAEANSANPNFSKLPSGSTGVWMGTVTSDWQQYSLSVDNNVNSLANAHDFVKFILTYDDDGDPSTPNSASSNNGGTVYIDDVRLTN